MQKQVLLWFEIKTAIAAGGWELEFGGGLARLSKALAWRFEGHDKRAHLEMIVRRRVEEIE